MYDVMLDFLIASPTETTMERINQWDFPKYQVGDYMSHHLGPDEDIEVAVIWCIEEPKRNQFPINGIKENYAEALNKWKIDDRLNKYYIPIQKKEVRNFSSWNPLMSNGSIMKKMKNEDCQKFEGKVWRHLGNGKFIHIGFDLQAVGLSAGRDYYSNRIMSIPLIKRFKDKDLKSMNIYVGETVADLLSNFTLDIPREQFVFPYPHGVSFVRKDFTTYLYQENEKIMWNYFGKDGKFRVNAIDLENITVNGRINEKSIAKFFLSEVKKLNHNASEFMNDYFERQFGIFTEKVPNQYCSIALIQSLMDCVYGIPTNFQEVIDLDEERAIEINEDKASSPKIGDCWTMIHYDLLKIICLNDRDFANEKLKKDSKGKAIISNTNPKRVGRRYFKWGEDDIQYVYPKGGKSGVKVRRHMRRGHTKRQPIKYPENYDGKAFQMGGSWYVSKTIAPYWAGGSLSIPENQISPFCFGAIKMKYAGGSRIASQWIRGIEKDLGRKLFHKENGGKEYRVPYNDTKWFFLDAWDDETNTAYEFHGDYYHGNPNIFNAEDINKTTKKTFGEMYNATMQKKAILEELGYNYVCIWEAEFM